MARINAGISKATYNIRRFRGLNENENGETALKDGEASVMRNFRVTDGGAITARPTLRRCIQLGNAESFLGRTDISLNTEYEFFDFSYMNEDAAENTPLYPGYTYSDGVFDISGDFILIMITTPAVDGIPENSFNHSFFKKNGIVYLLCGKESVSNRIYGRRLYVTGSVDALWSGYVGGIEKLIAAANGTVWELHRTYTEPPSYTKTAIGYYFGTDHISFFGFGDKLYILTGREYYSWSGSGQIEAVDGYVPCVLTACEPATGSGTALERINLLTQHRKCRYNADGTSTAYRILEANAELVSVYVDGSEETDYSYANNTVTFSTAPAAGTENVEIEYYVGDGEEHESSGTVRKTAFTHSYQFTDTNKGLEFESFKVYLDDSSVEADESDYTVYNGTTIYIRMSLDADTAKVVWRYRLPKSDVLAMRASELYNGTQDNRVFLYGDGTNRAIYSDIAENGQATAEYFPELNECRFGQSNSPISSIVKHYNRLLVFKANEAYSVYYAALELADESVTAGFYITSVNKDIGCSSPYQATLVDNRVRTVDGKDIYEWKPTGNSGNITFDQRNAQRISQSIGKTLGGFILPNTVLHYDKLRHEFYCIDRQSETALVQNTENGAWYRYTDFPVKIIREYLDDIGVCGLNDGYIAELDFEAEPDFECLWESGSLDFDMPYAYKLSPQIWVEIKPENGKTIVLSVKTDSGDELGKSVTTRPFGEVSPTIMARLKPRRFIRYKLGMATEDRMTVLGANVSVTYTVRVK